MRADRSQPALTTTGRRGYGTLVVTGTAAHCTLAWLARNWVALAVAGVQLGLVALGQTPTWTGLVYGRIICRNVRCCTGAEVVLSDQMLGAIVSSQS